jgi:alginate O-acetyltransferase complex protein AlgJ
VGHELYRTLHDGKIIEGRDGWYFLSNDTNQVVDQLSGQLPLTPVDLRAWQRLLESRIAWLGRLGIPYFFLVAPNPHMLYPEKLPEGLELSDQRPVMQLIGYLEQRGSFARAIYPRDEIVAARDARPVASPNDSHWNGFAAYVAYSKLIDEVAEQVAVGRLTDEQVVFSLRRRIGDLGAKLEPPLELPQVVANVIGGTARVLSDNQVHNRGRRVEFACASAPTTTCLVFGDSFTYKMLPFLMESFGRMTFALTSNFDHDLVEEIRPDVVVTLMNERFMRMRPTEFGAPTTAELAANKVKQGRDDAPHLSLLFGQDEADRAMAFADTAL